MSEFGPDWKRQRTGPNNMHAGYGPQGNMNPAMMPQQYMPDMQYQGGPPMMGGGGPGMGMGPMGMGPGMTQQFPCVKLRGLPFDVSEEDIRKFLEPVEPVDILLVKREGRLNGEAYVVLPNLVQVDMALEKNRSYLGRRYVEIFRAKKMDYYKAITEMMEGAAMGMGGPRGHGGMMHYGMEGGYQMGDGSGYMQGLPSGAAFDAATGAQGGSGGTTILKLRGLPYSITDEDIVAWFTDPSLGIPPPVKDNVMVVMEHGRPSGIAFVEFPTPQEATAAMGKNKQMMGNRYVEIFPAGKGDLERVRQRAGF